MTLNNFDSDKTEKQAEKILKCSMIAGILGIAEFLIIALVGLIVYGKAYFFDGYAITKVLCAVDIILMLFGAIGLLFSRQHCSVSQGKKNFTNVIVALTIAFSIVLTINGINELPIYSYSPSSNSSSEHSDPMDHDTYCKLYMKVSNVKVEHRNGYAYITGTVRNTGTYKIKYVKVRAVCKNYSGTIIDTDWTYAVDSDWLLPGESKTFKMMVRDTGNDIRTATVSIVVD